MDHYGVNRCRSCDHIIEYIGDIENIHKNTVSGVVTLSINPSGKRNDSQDSYQGKTCHVPCSQLAIRSNSEFEKKNQYFMKQSTNIY